MRTRLLPHYSRTTRIPRKLPTGNNITTVPLLNSLGKLQALDLGRNRITSLPAECFPPELGSTLRRLNLEDNRHVLQYVDIYIANVRESRRQPIKFVYMFLIGRKTSCLYIDACAGSRRKSSTQRYSPRKRIVLFLFVVLLGILFVGYTQLHKRASSLC